MLKEYLYKEFLHNVHPKYYKYFGEWFNNLLKNQIIYYDAYSKGLKTPFQNETFLCNQLEHKSS